MLNQALLERQLKLKTGYAKTQPCVARQARRPEPAQARAMTLRGQEWVKKHKMRMLAFHDNHYDIMDSIGSRSKKGMKDLILRPLYREIRHTLSGPNSVASVGLGFEEPFDHDDAIDEEQARVDSDLESDDDDGDDS
ncbi:hypothetical protein HAX54_052537 [Datura stramonium]|uniref:Uncharacterized protein n=1 Tax=Datura stramonium TaxID=4076 RepID=A0ABS8T041_DATST|nr:hypothetical protein [Datura stramonium]